MIDKLEKELFAIEYCDQKLLDFNIYDFGTRVIFVAEEFIMEFLNCTKVFIEGDIVNSFELLQFKNGKNSLYIQNIDIKEVLMTSKVAISNNHFKHGFAQAKAVKVEIDFALLNIEIECLEVNITDKKILKDKMNQLIEVQEYKIDIE